MELRKVFGRREPRAALEERLAVYREVLQANNAALGFMARIQEALAGHQPLSAAEVRRLVAGITVQTYRMIANLDRVTRGKQRAARQRFEKLRAEIARRVEVTPALGPVPAIIALDSLDASLAEQVGQKSALLGEARRLFPEQVPRGFATTVEAFRSFMAGGGLGERLAELLEGLQASDVARCFEASARAVQLVESAPVPPELADALQAAVAGLGGGASLRLAVRSSALQEGGLEVSFAGQYRSLLNVAPDGVVDAFRRVVASKYSPQALTYRLGRGYRDDEIGMCCCVMEMVQARAAGVLYSRYPGETGTARTVIQAVRGLGLSAVDGSVQPDTFLIDRRHGKLLEARVGLCARGGHRSRASAGGREGSARHQRRGGARALRLRVAPGRGAGPAG